jgi:hypothetical protein
MRFLIRLVIAAALTAYTSWALAADLAGTVRNKPGQPQPGVAVTLQVLRNSARISSGVDPRRNGGNTYGLPNAHSFR